MTSLRRLARVACAAALLVGCTCGSGLERAGESHPYVRCAASDPPEPRELRTAASVVHIEGRDVTIEPSGAPRIAVFVGPATAGEPFEPALDVLEAGAPSALFLVGSIGDDTASAHATLAALATLDAPTFLVLGGRDQPDIVASALSDVDEGARARLVDLSGVRSVRLGRLVLVPVPGAPDGRYATMGDACGLGVADVDAIASDLGGGEGEHRVLISWAAPASGTASTRGILGAEAGSSRVADVATRVGAVGWLAAFGATGPRPVRAAPRWDVALAVPPAVGVTERDDGGHFGAVPLMLEVGESGLVVLEDPSEASAVSTGSAR